MDLHYRAARSANSVATVRANQFPRSVSRVRQGPPISNAERILLGAPSCVHAICSNRAAPDVAGSHPGFGSAIVTLGPDKQRQMCNDYSNRIPYSAYLEAFSQPKIRLFAAGGPPNLEPRDDIWPTDVAPIIRSADGVPS